MVEAIAHAGKRNPLPATVAAPGGTPVAIQSPRNFIERSPMTRSIFDPTGGETEHSGSRNMGPAADNLSHMPPDVVDGEVPTEEALDMENAAPPEDATADWPGSDQPEAGGIEQPGKGSEGIE
jgi:hypothetical protein